MADPHHQQAPSPQVVNRLWWPLLGVAAVLLFNAVTSPAFFHFELRDGHLYGSLVDVLNRGAIGVVLATGMTLVIATGGVDLSVGSVMAISGAVAALLLTKTSAGLATVIPCALAAALAAGLLNGVLVAYLRIQPIVATLILMVCGRGIAKFLTGEQIITLTEEASRRGFDFLGGGHFLGLPFPVAIFVVLVAVTALAVRRTSLGLFIEAVGASAAASRIAGVNDRLIRLGVYGFSGLCAGIAGLVDASNIEAADTINAGVYSELDAIFAVVVGGTALSGGRFTLLGSVLGALLLQTLMTTLYTYGVPSDTAPIPKALVILAVCLLQSHVFRSQLRRLPSRK